MNSKSSTVEYKRPQNLSSPTRRLAAKIIDVLIAISLIYLATKITNLIMLPENIVPFIVLGVSGGYLLLSDAMPNGQSIGKRMLKISVVSEISYISCNVLQSVLRNLPVLFLSMLDAIFIFFGSRKRFGDMLASTIVINS